MLNLLKKKYMVAGLAGLIMLSLLAACGENPAPTARPDAGLVPATPAPEATPTQPPSSTAAPAATPTQPPPPTATPAATPTELSLPAPAAAPTEPGPPAAGPEPPATAQAGTRLPPAVPSTAVQPTAPAPAASSTRLPVVTPPTAPASSLLKTPPSGPAVTTAGTVTGLDLSGGTLQLATAGGQLNRVKLTARTTIIRKGQPVEASQIKVGDALTASGVLNAQGQVEATAIALDIIYPPRPIGDPGYPNEKG